MLTRKMILDAIDFLQEHISGQTLTNYIKAGVCVGAEGTERGIQSQGVQAEYTILTAIETAVARNILGNLSRKLTMEDIAFARYVSKKILSGDYFDFSNYYLKTLIEEFFGTRVELIESKEKIEYSKIIFSAKKTRIIKEYEELIAEWLYKYVYYSTIDIDFGFIDFQLRNKKELNRVVVPEDIAIRISSECVRDLVYIVKDENRSIGSGGYIFAKFLPYAGNVIEVDLPRKKVIVNNEVFDLLF